MVLSLSTASIGPLLGKKSGAMSLLDLPKFAREHLGLNGLHITTDLLKGADRHEVATLRERADKAGCACLVLVETALQPFGDPDDSVGDRAIERTERVLDAAAILGCNAASVPLKSPNTPEAMEVTVERLQIAVERAERLEINLLVSPTDGLTGDPERVADLIKKVGRFRVMTMPDFQRAAAWPDPALYLRRVTPYAGAICASTVLFAEPEGDDDPYDTEHEAYDLLPIIETVRAVGFDGSLGLDYRGKGDIAMGLLRTKNAIEQVIEVLEATE